MNPLIETIPPSLIRSISANKRPGDIDLGLGEPTLPPALPAFQAAVEWTAVHGSPYSPNAGFPELRQAVADYVSEYSGRDFGPANVCITVGSEEALYLAIKSAVDPAVHEVLIVEPCYLAYPKICMLEAVKYRTVALSASDHFLPDPKRVLAAIGTDTRLIVINSPANPTGRVWTADDLAELATGLEEKGREDILILSDEVYRELAYLGDAATPATAHPATLIAGSLSKSHSLTGLRLGWLVGPEPVVTAATKVHQFVNTAASTFSQQVALEILRQRSMRVNRAHYHRQRDLVVAAARDAGLEIIPPEGAFYMLIRLPESLRGDTLGAAEQLLAEQRVVAVPGSAFGDSGAGWLRISWIAPDDQLREGVRRIAEFFEGKGKRARLLGPASVQLEQLITQPSRSPPSWCRPSSSSCLPSPARLRSGPVRALR